MNTRIPAVLAAIALSALAPPLAGAQIPGLAPPGKSSAKAPALSADTAARGLAIDTATLVRPIPASEVPSVADHALVSAMDLLTSTAPRADLSKALAGIPLLLDSLARAEPVASLSARGLLTRRGLTGLGLEWSARDQEVREWRRVLKMAATHNDSARRELQRSLAQWRLTLAEPDTTLYPPAVRQRAENVLGRLVEVDSVLALRSAAILQAELGISDASARIFNELQAVATARSEARRNLLRAESPPLWKGLSTGGAMGTARSGPPGALQELAWFLAGNRSALLVHALLILLAMLVAQRYRTDLKRTAEFEVPTGPYYATLGHPVASVALLGIAIAALLYPLAPLAVYDLALLGATLPLFLLIPSLVPRDLVVTARVAVGFFVVQRCLAISLMGSPAYRLVVLGVSLLGFGLLSLGLRSGTPLRQREPAWRYAIQVVAWVLFACCALAVVANVLGNVTLADAMNAAIAGTVDFAILLWGVARVVEVLLSQAVRRGGTYSRYLRARGDLVLRTVDRVVEVGAALVWLSLSLQAFYLWGPLRNWLAGVFGTPIRVGEASLSLGIILLFGVVLWAGVMIARLVSGVLELDVLGRMNVRRGVPVTVGSLVRYALIAVAFLTALAATGVELSRFAILGGALGVGIGFGMQNIVNNFVSGLLLAFERPVSVGDTVQVGVNTGEIREIGIRASVIRTFEGAEVIVPNSELITKDVINWTRTGTRRRIEVSVGVAYGNDPARVIGLLADVAQAHPDVLGNPAAFALFTGFGANSLDFVVRAWTDSNDWIVVRSDIAVAVHGALRDSGIQIPFPQRDVHLKSADPGVLTHLQQVDEHAP